jgi:hypothetical protein
MTCPYENDCPYKHTEEEKKEFNIKECRKSDRECYGTVEKYRKTGEKILEAMDGVLLYDISVIIMQYVYIPDEIFGTHSWSLVRDCVFCEKLCCGLNSSDKSEDYHMLVDGIHGLMLHRDDLETKHCISANKTTKMCVNPLSTEYKLLSNKDYCHDKDHCFAIYNTSLVKYSVDHTNIYKTSIDPCKECGLTGPVGDLCFITHTTMINSMSYHNRGMFLHSKCTERVLSAGFLSKCCVVPYACML